MPLPLSCVCTPCCALLMLAPPPPCMCTRAWYHRRSKITPSLSPIRVLYVRVPHSLRSLGCGGQGDMDQGPSVECWTFEHAVAATAALLALSLYVPFSVLGQGVWQVCACMCVGVCVCVGVFGCAPVRVWLLLGAPESCSQREMGEGRCCARGSVVAHRVRMCVCRSVTQSWTFGSIPSSCCACT